MQRLILQLNRHRTIPSFLVMMLVALMMATQKLAARHLHVPLIGEEMLHNIGHVVVYGTLGALARCAAGRRVALAWLIVTAAACFEEWSQQFIPGRDCCIEDALLNAGSITLAMWLVGRLINRPFRTHQLRLVGG